MNHIGAGTLNAVEADAVATALGSMLRDTDTSGSLTVTTPTGEGSMDPATGSWAAPEVQDAPTGWTAPLTLREVSQGGGLLQAGDRRFIVMAADLSANPTTSPPTRIRHNSTDYAAVQVEQDPLGLSWHIIGRRTD